MQEEKTPFAPPADPRESAVRETVQALFHTLRRHRAAIEAALSDLGIHPSQHRMLMHLHRKGGRAAQKELAAELAISPAAVAVTLRKLEERDLICRAAEGRDSRCKAVSLAEAGEELLRVSHSAFTSVDLSMFASLSEEELSSFRHMLAAMQASLSEIHKEAEA